MSAPVGRHRVGSEAAATEASTLAQVEDSEVRKGRGSSFVHWTKDVGWVTGTAAAVGLGVFIGFVGSQLVGEGEMAACWDPTPRTLGSFAISPTLQARIIERPGSMDKFAPGLAAALGQAGVVSVEVQTDVPPQTTTYGVNAITRGDDDLAKQIAGFSSVNGTHPIPEDPTVRIDPGLNSAVTTAVVIRYTCK